MKLLPTSMFRGYIDFGILAVREDEYSALLIRFPPQWAAKGERTYDIASITTNAGDTYWVALLRTFEQGQNSAQSAASNLITDLDPSWLVLVGIAGAVPDYEFTLGDVVVATRFHDFSVTASLSDGSSETVAKGGPAHKAVQDWIARLAALKTELGNWNTDFILGV